MSNTLDNTALMATGISMAVLTTLVFGSRLALGLFERRQIAWEDGWLAAAYVVFLVITGLYLAAGPVIFRLEDLAAGRIEVYETIMDDSLAIQKTFFVTTSGLWISLWLVKASLLAVYKRLMTGLRVYIILWWITVAICVLTLAGAITSSMLSCSSMEAWFTAGACGTERDVKAAYISLWYAYAVDVFTDLLVMILPLQLIKNLQMRKNRKLSIAGLFCLGWICIAVSTIRVAYLGHNNGDRYVQPSTSWLALWAIVEAAIAVMIGCGPGLYRKANAVSKSRSNYYNMGAPTSSKQRSKTGTRQETISLQPYQATSHIQNGSSQEELVGMAIGDKIMVTQSVLVSSDSRAQTPR